MKKLFQSKGKDATAAASGAPAASPIVLPPGVVLLRIPADGDPKAGEEFDDMIAAALATRPRLIVVDLSARQFISTVMLGLLLKLRRDTSAFNGKVRLAQVQPLVRRVLNICRLDQLFGVFSSIAEAVEAPDTGTPGAGTPGAGTPGAGTPGTPGRA